MTNFKQFGKSPVLNDKLIRVDNDYDILFYFIKHYYRNAIRTCYLIQIKISSAVAADKKHAFLLCFFCQERSEGLLSLFFSSFPAIDIKKLLKWFAMIKSSEFVLLSIFKVIWWDPAFEIFMLMRDFIPYHILFEPFLLVSNMFWSSFLYTDDSELIFDFCSFWIEFSFRCW